MGASGWSIELERERNAAPVDELVDAVREHIVEQWLYWPRRRAWWEMAQSWVHRDLASIEVEENAEARVALMFMFYDSVRWPSLLAAHWVNLALARRRRKFEEKLGALGYAIHDSDGRFPTLLLQPRQHLFFVHDGKIGIADRKSIEWQTSTKSELDLPNTPFARLDAKGRAKVLRVLASNRCECPICVELAREIATPTAKPPWRLELVESSGSYDWPHAVRKLVQRRDGMLIVRGDGDRGHDLRSAPSPKGPWTGLATDFTTKGRAIRFLREEGRALVAWTESPDAPLQISSDFGKTWSPLPKVVGLRHDDRRFFVVDPHRPKRVFASSRSEFVRRSHKACELWRSEDGGRSWTNVTMAMSVQPKRLVHGLVYVDTSPDDPDLLFATCRLRQDDKPLFARSEDGGLTWQLVSTRVRRVLALPNGVVHGFATLGEKRAVHEKSIDGGVTWSASGTVKGSHRAACVTKSGRLFWATNQCVVTSTDDGATWEPVYEFGASTVLPDAFDADAAWIDARDTLMHLTRMMTS
jgi:hypothetical protein